MAAFKVFAIICIYSIFTMYCTEALKIKCDDDVSVPFKVFNPLNCKQYYTCYKGVITRHDCPEGQLYNRNEEHCETEENVHCGPP